MASSLRSVGTTMRHVTQAPSAKLAPRPVAFASPLRSTSYVSDVAPLRTAVAATGVSRCRLSAAVTVRAEISYVMIKPDGALVCICLKNRCTHRTFCCTTSIDTARIYNINPLFFCMYCQVCNVGWWVKSSLVSSAKDSNCVV
jgi:hypothetical protein